MSEEVVHLVGLENEAGGNDCPSHDWLLSLAALLDLVCRNLFGGGLLVVEMSLKDYHRCGGLDQDSLDFWRVA